MKVVKQSFGLFIFLIAYMAIDVNANSHKSREKKGKEVRRNTSTNTTNSSQITDNSTNNQTNNDQTPPNPNNQTDPNQNNTNPNKLPNTTLPSTAKLVFITVFYHGIEKLYDKGAFSEDGDIGKCK